MEQPIAEQLRHFDVFDESTAGQRYEFSATRSAAPRWPTQMPTTATTTSPASRTFARSARTLRYSARRSPALSTSRSGCHRSTRIRRCTGIIEWSSTGTSLRYLKRYEDDMRRLAHEMIDRCIDRGEVRVRVASSRSRSRPGRWRGSCSTKTTRSGCARAVDARDAIAIEGTPETYGEVAMLAAEFMADREAAGARETTC